MTISNPVIEAVQGAGESVVLIQPDLIQPNPWQTRVAIDGELIEDLAIDILVNGLLQPILVRPIQRGRLYELVFGQRRLLAIELLISRGQWNDGIPALVREMTDREVFMATLGENRLREDVNTVEESLALARALDEIPDLKQSELAKTLGVSTGQLSNRLRILKLPEAVLDKVRSGFLTWTAARELLVLVASDSHTHIEEIAETLGTAERWAKAARDPKITVRSMREAIVTRCANQPRAWRPMEAIEGFEGKPVSAPPEFDVDSFLEEHKDTLHTLPRQRSASGGAIWTCNGREWMRLQRAARAAAKVTRPAVEKPSPERDRWVDVMLEHPLVQQVAPGFSRENPSLTVQQEETLGTLVRRVNAASRLSFSVSMEVRSYGGPPDYLDQSECRSTCTKGAIIAPRYDSWGRQELHCTNQECFNAKLLEGKEKFRAKVEKRVEKNNARQERLADTLTHYLSDPGLAQGLGRFLAQTIEATPESPSRRRGDEDLNYYPAALKRAARAIDIKVGDPVSADFLWTSGDVNRRLADSKDPGAFTAELLALALDSVGMSARALKRLPPTVTTDMECANHDPRPAYESVRVPGSNGKTVPRKVRWGAKCSECRAVTFDDDDG